MFKRFYRNRYGYSRWDGTQNIEGLDADDILNAMADDYMEEGNLQQALKRLMQDGIRNEDGRKTMGLRELMERMRNMRNEQLNRYNMASGVMDDLREKLEEIKNLEREGMQQSLQNMTPEDIAKMREMIRDLNKMLRDRQEGREPDFDSFMQKHGEYFPGVNSLDDLIEQMQQQMAAMQGIMDNLSPEQRQELQNLMEQLMGDDRIRVDMMELAMNLEALAPMEQMRTRFPFRGDESLPLNEAMRR